MSNWDVFLKNNEISLEIYSLSSLKSLVGNKNFIAIQRLKDVLTKIEGQLFVELRDLTNNKAERKDFFMLSHKKRWEVLMKSEVITFQLYDRIVDIIYLVDGESAPTETNIQGALKALDTMFDLLATRHLEVDLIVEQPVQTEAITQSQLVHNYKERYDLLPSIAHIFTSRGGLTVFELFWDIFIVHFELDNRKYTYDLVKTMAKYNPDGAYAHLKTLTRYLAVARANYLAVEKDLPLDDIFTNKEKFARASTEELWNYVYIAYKLPEEEYEDVKKLLTFISQTTAPKGIVEITFKLFERLMKFFMKAVQQEQNKLAKETSTEVIEESETLRKEQAVSQNKLGKLTAEQIKQEPLVGPSVIEQSKEDNEVEINVPVSEIEHTAKESENEKQYFPLSKQQQSKALETKPIVVNQEYAKYGAQFLQKIKGLQKSSNEAVVNANKLGLLQSYMHVERNVEREMIQALEQLQAAQSPQVLLLLGSVGDGKSHLLAYLKETKPNLFENVYVHNDATESHNRTRPAEETLERILQPFEDPMTPTQHVVIAINYGKLHNFYLLQQEKSAFPMFRMYIDSLNIFANTVTLVQSVATHFQTVDFSKEKYYSVHQSGVTSKFFTEILEKITKPVEENEIYQAWLKDKQENKWTIAHENYALLMNKMVRKRIVEKLIHVIVRNKMIVSTREFYNFIVDILVPAEILLNPQNTGFSITNALPNLMFNHPDRSPILAALYELDPINVKKSLNDELIANIYMHPALDRYLKEFITLDEQLLFEVYWKNELQAGNHLEIARFVIRIMELINEEDSHSDFSVFIRYLYAFYKADGDVIEDMFNFLEKVVFQWIGMPEEGYAYISNNLKKNYRMAIPMNLEGTLDDDVYGSVDGEAIPAANHYITVGFNNITFDLDLKLFEILRQVSRGQRPNLHEVGQAIQFGDFYNNLVKHIENKEKKILIVHVPTNGRYEISKPKYSKSKFEVKKV